MKNFKGKIALLLSAVILCLNFTISANAAVSNKTQEHIANLVYFVDFKDSEGNFMDGKVTRIKEMFNGNTNSSLTNYIKTISYNKMNVHNYFPQEKNGTIVPYRMSQNRSYYNKYNEYEMLMEVIKNVSVDSKYNLDMNNDGFVDNVIFIFGSTASGANGVLEAHKANLNGASTINGKRVDAYNVHSSYGLIGSIVSSAEGVLAHEFLHSVGYPDLYRSSANGDPVGRWDIMASTSLYLQYPLAYTRSAISNWITIDTIKNNGRYTLKPASTATANDHQAFILKTPMSDKEFFVVEYRKQGDGYRGELEAKIPGSGLIIYRVNTEQTTNITGGKDYLYVFRPGETEEGAAKGDLTKSFLSKDSGRTSYGSDDFTKKIKDNAITYSSGQNSGIVIENVSEARDTISFDVKFTDTSSLGLWDTVGKVAVSNNSDTNIAMDVVSNKVYAVYNEGTYNNKKLKARMFNGTDWVNLGDVVANEECYEPKIKVYNDIPYVLYHDRNYNAVVARFKNNKWEKVQALTTAVSQYSDMLVTDDGLYIAYTDSGASVLKSFKFNDSTNKFEQIGGNIHTGYVVAPILTESKGKIYVSYTDFYQKSKVYIKKYENGKWSDVSGIDTSASKIAFKAYGNKLYLGVVPTSNNGETKVYEFNGTTWNTIGTRLGGKEISDLKIDIYNGKVYAAYIDNSNGSSVVKKLDGSNWVNEGATVSDEQSGKIDFKIYGNKAYVATSSYSSENFIIKTRALGEDILEDINKDGVVDTLDLSMLSSKYNIDSTKSTYDKKLDLNNDGIIDIYDIVKVARKFSNQ